MTEIILETKRLRLLPLVESDAEFIVELLNSDGFLKNIGDRKVRSLEDAKNYITKGPRLSYSSNGYGLYRVDIKETQEKIGICGLVKRDVFDHADIGFAFLPRYFRKGYALESAKGVLDYAKNTLKMPKVLGITKYHNQASIGVLEKLGLSYEGPFRLTPEEEEGKLFSISF
ncbi:MAG: GNAT family N-acetyltransferase [Bdellovibrionales bacterium]|nr:GNAT family N-acetyltransferase [Bdellovibrionales bacterium]